MTEAEMAEVWCPQAKINEPRLFGDGCESVRHDRCIGSKCGWWRWVEPDSLDKPTRVHPNVLKDHWQGWKITDPKPDAKGYVEISPPPPRAPHGYCGAAGKP